ncbi:hypothetical protein C0995_007724 [Termitomyces sp. Mi166|nr:hypothetical protein C0995_007724 [Termitomyces sp. Mi166\
MHLHLKHLTLFRLLIGLHLIYGSAIPSRGAKADSARSPRVLVLGGGVAGVIAARTLHEQGIDDFVLVESRPELGGRLQSTPFGGYVIEFGANWIQGTQTGNGPINPIWELAEEHGLKTQISNFFSSITTFDETGEVNFVGVLNAAVDDFDEFVNYSDLTGRSTYDFIGKKPLDAQQRAAEYYNFDWEYAQTPLQSSGVATARNSNLTFEADAGGFSDVNLMSIDQRGYKTFIQQEAMSFLKSSQLSLNTLVKSVEWSASGVKAVFSNGSSISADYAICTFSLGVLKNDDVKFEPDFPNYKAEAIASMTMGTYTKIFLQFPEKFWFDTEVGMFLPFIICTGVLFCGVHIQFALYADSERGRYPVWQSLDMEGFLPGSGIIFVTVTGDYSERIEALSDAEVRAEAMSVLQTMYPNITIPEPLDFKFHRWFNDPLYRGSYSNWPPSFVKQHHANLRANVGRLYFAGEATSQDYYGYLQAAYFEGRDIANIVAKCIKGNGCVSLQFYEELEIDEDGLDELRSDTFERSYAMRWLTSLVSLTADWDSESHKEWEGLVQEAASLLAVCSGTAGAGVVIRDFVFKLGPEMEQTLDIQVKDISLDNKDYGSVGAQTWGGACVLTETILDDPVAFGLFDARELRILELGAGTGLVSLALGKLFKSTGSSIPPRTIIATDYYQSVMENLASNIQRNFPDSYAVQARFLDWSSFPTKAAEPPFDIPFDLILGADIIYEAQHAIWIKSCLARLLRKPTSSQDPLFRLMIPLRPTHSFESSTIDSVFAAPTPDSNPSELYLAIVSRESILCDAPGRGQDPIEYAYYTIGWRQN